MAVLVAVLFFLAKILLGLAAVAAVLGLAFLILPIRVRVSGGVRLDGDFEEFLEGEGAIGIGGQPCSDTPVTLALAGQTALRCLGGALGVDYSTETGFRMVTFGLPVKAPRGRKGASKQPDPSRPPESRQEDAVHRGRHNNGLLDRIMKARGKKDALDRQSRSSRRRRVRLAESKAWLAPPVRQRFLAAAKDLFRSLHFSGHVRARLGLPDPSVTGMVYAAFVTWSGATGERWLTFVPDFADDVAAVEVDGSIKVVGAQIVWIAGRFLLSRDIRPLWQKRRAGESKKAPVLGAHTTG